MAFLTFDLFLFSSSLIQTKTMKKIKAGNKEIRKKEIRKEGIR
jgi:hypothetical protein